jgi:hypothetical protein
MELMALKYQMSKMRCRLTSTTMSSNWGMVKMGRVRWWMKWSCSRMSSRSRDWMGRWGTKNCCCRSLRRPSRSCRVTCCSKWRKSIKRGWCSCSKNSTKLNSKSKHLSRGRSLDLSSKNCSSRFSCSRRKICSKNKFRNRWGSSSPKSKNWNLICSNLRLRK